MDSEGWTIQSGTFFRFLVSCRSVQHGLARTFRIDVTGTLHHIIARRKLGHVPQYISNYLSISR